MKKIRLILFIGILSVFMAQSQLLAQIGQFDWKTSTKLYPGVERANVKVTVPRKMNINCLRVDTKTRNLKFYTTPRYEPWEANVSETKRQTTRNFIRNSQSTDKKIVVAINCDAFTPWPAPWDKETVSNLLGLVVSEGILVSPGSGEPSLMIDKKGKPSIAITTAQTDITNIDTAVSGFHLVMTDGNVLPSDKSLHPRTGTGVSEDGRFVYLVTIDGRQSESGGSTTAELGDWLKHFGAFSGINMDGGGSTTMAWWDPDAAGTDKAMLLNVPVGGGRINSERANGNNLGIYYLPSKPSPAKKLLPWALVVGVFLLVK